MRGHRLSEAQLDALKEREQRLVEEREELQKIMDHSTEEADRVIESSKVHVTVEANRITANQTAEGDRVIQALKDYLDDRIPPRRKVAANEPKAEGGKTEKQIKAEEARAAKQAEKKRQKIEKAEEARAVQEAKKKRKREEKAEEKAKLQSATQQAKALIKAANDKYKKYLDENTPKKKPRETKSVMT